MRFILLLLTLLFTAATPVYAWSSEQILSVRMHNKHPNVVRINESIYGVAEDDTDFLFRLGMLEGHLMIGHDLLQHNQVNLALPHFGHPVRELYEDISDYLKKKNFPAFDKELARLEVTVTSNPAGPEIEKQYQAMLVTLHKARELAPEALRASLPEMIKVCSNTIDAASGEYNESLEHGQIRAVVEYHDSRGYLQFVDQEIRDLLVTHSDPQSQVLLKKLQTVLAKAEWIVEPLIPSAAPRASVSQYRAIAEEAAEIGKSAKPVATPAIKAL